MQGGCDGGIVDPDYPFTLVVEFELYCEKRTLRALLEATPFVGCIIGLIIFNIIADNKGKIQLYLINLLRKSISFINFLGYWSDLCDWIFF